MAVRDVGDRVNLQHLVYNAARVLTNATVVLTVTDPAGATSNPSVANSSTGTYDASFTLSSAGVWSWVWDVSGTVIDVDRGSVLAATPGPITYATLPELKAYGPIADTVDDVQLQDALVAASRSIDHYCDRSFGLDSTATARVFRPRSARLAVVDDFWTSTGLIVGVDSDGDGVFETTYTTADYSLEPANGIVSGEAGWPYYRILAVNQNWACQIRPTIQVTAKWGWASVPGPVHSACVLMASEIFKLKGAPFGVAGFGEFGPIRVRDNPRVMSMLNPYRRDPVLMA